MWKFLKYRFNKAFEQNLFNLVLFLIGIQCCWNFILFHTFFFLQKIGLLGEDNFTTTVWQAFNLFFDQNAIFGLDVDKNNFFDFFFKFNVTIFGIIIFQH